MTHPLLRYWQGNGLTPQMLEDRLDYQENQVTDRERNMQRQCKLRNKGEGGCPCLHVHECHCPTPEAAATIAQEKAIEAAKLADFRARLQARRDARNVNR